MYKQNKCTNKINVQKHEYNVQTKYLYKTKCTNKVNVETK